MTVIRLRLPPLKQSVRFFCQDLKTWMDYQISQFLFSGLLKYINNNIVLISSNFYLVE